MQNQLISSFWRHPQHHLILKYLLFCRHNKYSPLSWVCPGAQAGIGEVMVGTGDAGNPLVELENEPVDQKLGPVVIALVPL